MAHKLKPPIINNGGMKNFAGILWARNNKGIAKTRLFIPTVKEISANTDFFSSYPKPKSGWYTHSYKKLADTFVAILTIIAPNKEIIIAGLAFVVNQNTSISRKSFSLKVCYWRTWVDRGLSLIEDFSISEFLGSTTKNAEITPVVRAMSARIVNCIVRLKVLVNLYNTV